MSFESFKFQPFIYEALAEKKFTSPTEVQEKLIPVIQKRSQCRGTIPNWKWEDAYIFASFDGSNRSAKDEVQVVITAPSRELATQIYQAAKQLAEFQQPEIRVTNFVGGTDKQRQMDRLQNQQPQLVIGTPGRILDMINEQALAVHTAQAFVIDEADMTLDMGFLEEVDQIASRLPEKTANVSFLCNDSRKAASILKNISKIH